MGLAAILEHLQSERGLLRVVEIVSQVLRVQMLYTRLETDGALLEDAEFLIAHGHIMERQQEYKLVARYLVRLDLVEHRLRLLEQDQRFLVLLL